MARRKKKKIPAGNFRKPTPAAAEQYLKYWQGRGVTNASQLTAALEGKSEKQKKLARIRFNEARAVLRAYNRKKAQVDSKYEKEKAAYDQAKEEHKQALAEWNDLKKKGVKERGPKPQAPKRPSKRTVTRKSKAKDPRRKGNFKRMTKAQAKAYLKKLLRKPPKNLVTIDSQGNLQALSEAAIGRSYQWSKKNQFRPRVAEAIALIGPSEAAKLLNRAQELVARAQAKQVKVQAKKAETAAKRRANKLKNLDKVVAKIQANKAKYLERVEKKLADLAEKKRSIQTVAAAARKRRSKKRKAKRKMKRRSKRKMKKR